MMDKENKNERGIILPHPQEIFSEERLFGTHPLIL
jgi:hypothetical protein